MSYLKELNSFSINFDGYLLHSPSIIYFHNRIKFPPLGSSRTFEPKREPLIQVTRNVFVKVKLGITFKTSYKELKITGRFLSLNKTGFPLGEANTGSITEN